ncbi:MAG TPA: DEAD/DEAH box helicase, partial [Oscillatoriaceae cyanobacterium]
MDERFEWLEIPEDDPVVPAPDARAWMPAAVETALHAKVPASPTTEALRALGVDLPERRIELIPTSLGPSDPYALYALRLQSERLRLASGFERLQCLDQIAVRPLEHQIAAALKALRDMRGRAILADEVGLGKTIEAGLVAKELVVRGLARRILVLVPASLTQQWQEELSSKFGEPFIVARRPEDWEQPRVIASLDLAKHERHSAHALAHDYDLLIVDEAHKLRRASTQAHRFVNRVRKRYVLLLTATPVQNDLTELFQLVTILQPGQLGTVRSFRDSYMDAGDPRSPRNAGPLRELLSEVMVRHRRATIGVKLPPRRAGIYHLNL